jgi:predicted NodU family carbamoyl transferase
LYSQVTLACGFRQSRHEGKITRLAAYGDPLKSESYFDSCVSVKEGSMHIQLAKNDVLSKLKRVAGNYMSGQHTTKAGRIIADIKHIGKEDLSAGVQRMLEKRSMEFIDYWMKKVARKTWLYPRRHYQ